MRIVQMELYSGDVVWMKLGTDRQRTAAEIRTTLKDARQYKLGDEVEFVDEETRQIRKA